MCLTPDGHYSNPILFTSLRSSFWSRFECLQDQAAAHEHTLRLTRSGVVLSASEILETLRRLFQLMSTPCVSPPEAFQQSLNFVGDLAEIYKVIILVSTEHALRLPSQSTHVFINFVSETALRRPCRHWTIIRDRDH